MTVEVVAPAKVNLTLHVTGKRADGYHLLDSLVVFGDVADRLWLDPGAKLTLEVSGLFAKGVPEDERNLVWRAAEGAGWRGNIRLQKNLPHGAGIGGGSSDAGAVLNALKASGVLIPSALPLSLGADVPVCCHAGAARMRGIGERVDPLKLPKLHALLVNPGLPLPTGKVFSALVNRDNSPMPDELPEFTSASDCAAWLEKQRNDLEGPAIAVAPEIDRVLSDLRATGEAMLSRMSGSGATCFALYPTAKAAHMAAYQIGAEHPDWWCQATCLT